MKVDPKDFEITRERAGYWVPPMVCIRHIPTGRRVRWSEKWCKTWSDAESAAMRKMINRLVEDEAQDRSGGEG